MQRFLSVYGRFRGEGGARAGWVLRGAALAAGLGSGVYVTKEYVGKLQLVSRVS
jgi:hypothetical protein